MTERVLFFNVEIWGSGVPQQEMSVMFPNMKTYDTVYSHIINSLSQHLQVNREDLKIKFDMDDRTEDQMKVYIKKSRIHKQFFGRMSTEDEDGSDRAFVLSLKYNGESYGENSYVNYYHEFSVDGVTFYCNIHGWHDPETDSFNVMNRYIN